MKLYLMQHGEAVSKDVDPDRPLSETGRRDVERIGDFLSQAPFDPERAFHSGKTRARQSAEILAQRAAPGATVEAMDGINPKDDIEPIAKKACDRNGDTVLVGHLPFLGRLVSHLVRSRAESDAVAYQPGSIVCLERNEAGDWQIAWMIRPELLGG